MTELPDFDIAEFLTPGIEPDDVPALWSLVRSRELINTFITLFRGGEEEVFIRLHVLREVGGRADHPRWLPEELRRHFAYIDPIKLETVLGRLRANNLLIYGEDGAYQFSDAGRNAVAAMAVLLRFGENEDSELGCLTTQLAGMQATGTVTPELLQHLLAKLNALTTSFEEAIASGSEFRILDARSRLSGNMRWLEKGTNVLRGLLATDEITPETSRIAHAIGLAQSRLARVDAAFQRAVNKIEAQRVTLGGSGISSSDVAGWLRRLDSRGLAVGALTLAPELTLLAGGHELLDRAELTLSDEARQIEADTALPPFEAAPRRAEPEPEDLRLLQHFSQRLARLAEPGHAPETLAALVSGGGFPAASYRLSLLALLADAGSGDDANAPADGPIGDFMRLPLDVHFDAATVAVGSDEIAAMSAGLVGARGSLPAPQPVPVLDATALPPDEA